jgi:hypothetical protein
LIGISPWFHFKNGIAFATIGVLAFILIAREARGRDRIVRLASLALPAVIGAAAYELAIHTWFGSWLPTRMFGPGNDAFAISPATGLQAALFDRARGLITNCPALILVLIGLPLWARRFPGPTGRLGLVLLPTIWVQSTFNDWSGGNAPPARYAMQFAPLLVPAIAILLQRAPRALRSFASAVIALGWSVAAAHVWLRPAWGYAGDRSDLFAAIDKRVGPALDRVMPAFDVNGRLTKGGFALTCWLALSAIAVIAGTIASASYRWSNGEISRERDE